MVLDVAINNRKWAIIGIYRPPSMDNTYFTDLFTRGMDPITTKFDYMLILGDLYYDCLDRNKGVTLFNIYDIFDFKTMIKSATRFMKNCQPSLVDVVLSNQPRLCSGTLNFGCGFSDWHTMIGVAVKGAAARVEKQKTKYRNFKHVDQKEYNEDVGRIPFHAVYVFDDDDGMYWAHETLLTDIIDQHAPVKEKVIKQRGQLLCMGTSVVLCTRKADFNKYTTCRSSANWENYRKQRNHVTKLKK